jgi:hypothetical protein
MFVNSIKKVEQFTRPLFAISRSFENININQDSATIFFVNEFGFALTSGDVIEKFFPEQPYYEKYLKFKESSLSSRYNIEKLKTDYDYNNPNTIIELKTIFLNCGNGLKELTHYYIQIII